MSLCMAAGGYEVLPRCASSRFERFDGKCYTQKGFSPIAWITDALTESDLLFGSTDKPYRLRLEH
jgi:hypothetical protein